MPFYIKLESRVAVLGTSLKFRPHTTCHRRSYLEQVRRLYGSCAEVFLCLPAFSIGVVGLTTALQAQDEGHSVTIIADTFPTDSRLQHRSYTSQWAAAILQSFAEADDKWLQAVEKETFEVFLRLSDPQSADAESCFLWVDTKCYFEAIPQGPWQTAGADFLIGVRSY